MKYQIVNIAADKDGVINIPDGSIIVGEPKIGNYVVGTTEDSLEYGVRYSTNVWIPVIDK